MKFSNLYKAPKGLIRIEAEVENQKIMDIKITGDFFMVPEESILTLESSLRGVSLSREEVAKVVSQFYKSGVVTPMLHHEDMVNAICGVTSAR